MKNRGVFAIVSAWAQGLLHRSPITEAPKESFEGMHTEARRIVNTPPRAFGSSGRKLRRHLDPAAVKRALENAVAIV